MKKKFKIILIALFIAAAAALAGLYISEQYIPVMDPQGMIGIKQRNLIVTSSVLMLIIIIPVYIMTWVIAWKYRAGNPKGEHAPDWEHNYIAEYCWWGVPFVIVVILGFLTWKSSHDLNPYKPIETDKKPIVIQVVALDWKWLFIYPEEGIATINFMQFPEKTPLNFQITSDAPMNSFWIPALGGQIYAMPAMTTKLHLIANETGTFRGVSANISGVGFAGMVFTAKATSQEDFDQWVQKAKSSSSLGFNEYEKLVEPSSYEPAAFYSLAQSDLFDRILMKYSPPSKE
jgi:cytochrome o ubiquinol oxidase subunit II